MKTLSLTLPKWYDLHAHFRQDELLKITVSAHVVMGCAGVVAMPNTQPPVAKVFESDEGTSLSIEFYRQQIMDAADGSFSEVIVPLYLSAATTPEMILQGARDGLLRAAKYYPPHGTTGAEHGQSLQTYFDNGVFSAMAEAGIILCVHGEEHGLSGEAYFGRESNAEEVFYLQRMPRLVDRFPDLKVVAEHLTSKVGVDFVLQAGDSVGATVTPQHLLYTVGDLLQNLKYHLYCLPLVKYAADRQALRDAVTSAENRQFFAGTDSAPHTNKVTPCGCAAGCFTGGIAPQLYAEAFELAQVDLSSRQGSTAYRRFMLDNGATFYGLPTPKENFKLLKQQVSVESLATPQGDIIPLPLGVGSDCPQGTATLNWRLGGLD